MVLRRKRMGVLVGRLFGAVTLLGVAGLAYGQAATPVERLEITGTRIASPNAESPSPLQIITSEDIAASGVANIQELLLKNPTLGTPTISRTNSNFQTSSAGVSTVDLRNLGISRTLVLVNGRRFVAGIPGESAVDLNTIPVDFIERVELLTGGASATYGSDAVAGVINIILKRNFEGVVVDLQKGRSSKGDDEKDKIGITFGTTSANGKGSMMGHFGWSNQGAVYSRDRDFSAVDQFSTGVGVTGDPADLFAITRPFYSSFAPQGRFFHDTGSFTFDENGNVRPWSTNGTATLSPSGFNRSAFRTIAVPTERYLFAGKGDYEFAPNHSAFFEGTYASTQTTSVLEPFPLGAESIFPASGGQVPAEFLVNGVLRRNPTIPDYLWDRISDTDGDGARDYYFTRRLSEVGARGSVADRDTFHFTTGVKGTFGRIWDYSVFGGYGQTKEAQTSSGQVNVLNFRNALEAIPDVNDINGNGSTTDAICRDANARAQGCVPISVFGFNSITPAALAYVTAPGLLTTFTSQKLWGGNVSGEPFAWRAGPIGVAAGFEHREEYARSEFDPLQQAGLNAGNAIPRTEGSFKVTEFYAEGRVPLLKDVGPAKLLSVQGAVRTGDYSTVGNTLSWNAGMELALAGNVKLRAVRARSTRAPNINELYSPPSQDFPTGLTDPCLGVTATTAGPSADACRAAPGVNANIAANGAFTLNQADLQGVSGYNRGNPNLGEEQGDSWTFGVIFTPKAVPVLNRFTFTADYFKIKIGDAIVSTPRQFILDQCYSGDATLCQFITRRPASVGANSAGSLEFIDSAVTNSGGLATEGVDLTVSFGDKVGPGFLNARLAYTYTREAYTIPLPGAAKDNFAGEIGAPKHKGSLTVGYKLGNFAIAGTSTYIGSSALDDQFLAGFDMAPGSVKVGSKIYSDFQFNYQWHKKSQIYFGIDNAFNTKPAPIISGLPGNDTGAETDAGTYDAIGRRYYVGVRFTL